jgi:hypothetical protein
MMAMPRNRVLVLLAGTILCGPTLAQETYTPGDDALIASR